MKILNSKIHGLVDYAVVVFLLLSPTLFTMSPTIANLTYALAFVHLTLTVLTNFEYGVFKIVPLRLHGWVELVVGIVLLATPLILASSYETFVDKYFFAFFGVAVLATWAVSDYSTKSV